MRRLLVWNVMSLNGLFEGAEPWDLRHHATVWGKELEALSDEQLRSADLLLFGRKTYTGMASYWENSIEPEAGAMNSIAKAVISNTLTEAKWNNSRLISGDAVEEVRKLKAMPGRDIFIFGSAELVAPLLAAGLIDEYRLCIAPIVLGGGTPLFKPAGTDLPMQLLDSRVLEGGGILLFYKPANAG